MEMQLSAVVSWPHLLVILLPIIFLVYLRRRDPKNQPQGPGDDDEDLKSYPLLGRFPHFVKNQHRLLEWSVHVAKRSPTRTTTFKAIGIPGIVLTANPDNLEHIAKTNFSNYPKGEYMLTKIEDLLGRGIFCSDGHQWLWQRKAASFEFSKRSQRKFVVDAVRSELVDRLLPLLDLQASRHGRSTLDMQHVFECFSFDNICFTAFGEDPACLAVEVEVEGGTTPATPHQKEALEFMRAFDYVQYAILTRFAPSESVLWRVKKALNMEPEKQIREALDTVLGYADRIVQRCKERGEAEPGSRGDFLAHLAASGVGELSDQSLRDVVTNFLLAGRDTTATALTWFFWLVSGRPDVEEKIVREVKKVRRIHGSTWTTFSLDELREMHYIHAAITEGMRLYPPVPQGMHTSKSDDVLPDGTFVGKGWAVNHSVYAMARLEELWGKDCEEFRPERWLREDGTFQPESPFKSPVFFAGPRMCLGKEMAYIQMKSVVACAFERFSFRYLGGEDHPAMEISFLLRMKAGLPMQVTKRQQAS